MATVIEQLNWSQRVNNELDSSRTWQKNWSVLYGGAQSIPEQVGNSFELLSYAIEEDDCTTAT
jgi:hypothetical protein